MLLVGGFVPVVLATSLAVWRMTGRITALQVLTMSSWRCLAGLTVGYNDERFFTMRTVVVCLTLLSILWRGRSWVSGVDGGMVTLSPADWIYMTRRFAGVLLVLAAANEVVWRNFSTDVWMAYNSFVIPAGFFGYLGWQIRRAKAL